MSSRQIQIVVGILIVIAIGVGLVMIAERNRKIIAEKMGTVSVAGIEAEKKPEAAEAPSGAQSGAKTDKAAETKPETEPRQETASGPQPLPPSFDVARFEPAGDGVLAGLAAPGALVELLANDEPLATTTATEVGEWVIVLEKPLAPGNYDLALRSTPAEGEATMSEEFIAVVIPEKPSGDVLVVASRPGQASEILSRPEGRQTAETPVSQEAEKQTGTDPAPQEATTEVADTEEKPASSDEKIAVAENAQSTEETSAEATQGKSEENVQIAEAAPVKPATGSGDSGSEATGEVAVAEAVSPTPGDATTVPATSADDAADAKGAIAQAGKVGQSAEQLAAATETAKTDQDTAADAVQAATTSGSKADEDVNAMTATDGSAGQEPQGDTGEKTAEVAVAGVETLPEVSGENAETAPAPTAGAGNSAEIEQAGQAAGGATAPDGRAGSDTGNVEMAAGQPDPVKSGSESKTMASGDTGSTDEMAADAAPAPVEKAAPMTVDAPVSDTAETATAEAGSAAQKKPESPPSETTAAAAGDGQTAKTGNGEAALAAVEKPVFDETDDKPVPEQAAPASQRKEAETQIAAAAPEKEPVVASKPEKPKKVVNLALDAVETEGRMVYAAGTGNPGARVRVYVDNSLIGETMANADGRWLLETPAEIPAGDVIVRADELDEGAAEVSRRAEVPFVKQVDSIALLPSSATAGGGAGQTAEKAHLDGPKSVIIRRGDNLWTISRRVYGRGIRYTTIYKANDDQIRNPHRIYPGQVFVIPDGEKAWSQ